MATKATSCRNPTGSDLSGSWGEVSNHAGQPYLRDLPSKGLRKVAFFGVSRSAASFSFLLMN